MSIRLRFTLLYSGILAITLVVFGVALYSIQSHVTYDSLKSDILHSSDTVGTTVLASITNSNGQSPAEPPPQRPKPVPFENFSGDPAFQKLPEREIVRVLDAQGNLVASPFGLSEDALPLSSAGLAAVQNQQTWWETATVQDQSMLIYSRPVVSNGQVAYILQVARPLTEQTRSLSTLGIIYSIASLVTLIIAFGIGWAFSGFTFRPIKRITQTARTIGDERDFTRRVDYSGPPDEVGELATTFNAMLAQLQDAYQKVAHSLHMQRDFVADVSHELRTPLTTLRGNLGLMRHEPPIPAEEQADILNDMVDESDRLIRLVNDLLTLARADTGRQLSSEPIIISPLLEETVRQARQLDPQRSISLESDNLSIIGDRDAFKQVLLIALDNALKHSTGDVAVTAHLAGNQVEVRVQDSGQGIPPDTLEHIFDRFYRGEDAVVTSGFGLGLPIAKSLVEGMGGSIRMVSNLGEGSTLIIRFPGIS